MTLGSDNNRRITADINPPINGNVSVRLNAMYEKSDSYRDGVTLERSGINPTVSWKSGQTLVTAGYEHFKDDRIADRGISSYLGKPVDTDPSTFFGNAANSPTWSRLDAFNLFVEHESGKGILLKNRTRYSDQDKFYQNVFPGAVNAAGTGVAINAYNNATSRASFFNQTDLSYKLDTGGIRHTLLAGVELGQQDTDKFRNTGYFPGNNVTSVTVPLSNPTTDLPLTLRRAATDADNSGKAKVVAFYVQDQLEITKQFQVIAGLRYDQFEVDFTDNRTAQNFDTKDNLVSPRLGVIYKPFDAMVLYANSSITYQPRAGEQLSSLTMTNAVLDPEKFKSSRRHLSAEDVFRTAVMKQRDGSLPTVYRVLTQFADAGLLVRQHFEPACTVFELNDGNDHDHLVCLRCGWIEEFSDARFVELQHEIAASEGFDLRGHRFPLYGRCSRADCRKPG